MQEPSSSPNQPLANVILHCALAYLLLGPLVAYVFACLSMPHGLLFLEFFVFGVPVAYMLGAFPALFAGTIHAVLRQNIRKRAWRLVIIPCVSALIIGAVVLPFHIRPSRTPHHGGPPMPMPAGRPAPAPDPIPGSDPLPIIAAAAVVGLIVELIGRGSR